MARSRSRDWLLAGEAAWCLRANTWCERETTRALFGAVSRLGDGAFWYALMLALVCHRRHRGPARHPCTWPPPARSRCWPTATQALRPAGRGPFAGDRRIRAWVAPLDEFSFPSGHTLHATAFSVVAVAHYPVLAWLLAPFALAVAASRVVLGLHYPSDVLAAIAIGGLLAAASLWLVPGASLFA